MIRPTHSHSSQFSSADSSAHSLLKKVCFGTFLVLCAMTASAQNSMQTLSSNAEVESTLKAFFSSESKAREIMDAHLQKYDSNGHPVKGKTLFSEKQIRTKSFVNAKNKMRDQIFKINKNGVKVYVRDLVGGRAEIAYNDDVSDLVDNGSAAIRNLKEMEDKNLMSARLNESPWSDTYWPLYQGTTGNRYNDPKFPASENWKKNFEYVSRNPNVDVDALSPSEKYDLLIGDRSGAYTRTQWAEGESYFESSGKVETWMGICHGWAPAAFMLPRPTNVVQATAADGHTVINFYPSDIKALASSLWASARTPSKFIGGRCDIKDPKKASSGRVIDQECFDNNPGAWHMAVVNQIGVSKRGFVMDVTYDIEVWNQPTFGYKYSYFNPLTQKTSEKMEDSVIRMSDYANDRFKEFRKNPNAVSVVGVAMEMSYVVETDPSNARVDSPDRDAIQRVRYMYDLEIDVNGNIVGGEWYTNQHPDFLWVPPVGTRAVTLSDSYATGSWDPRSGEAVPASYRMAGRMAARERMPLAKVVEALIEASQKTR